MKVVVTGAAGYLGAVASRTLIQSGHEVVGVDSLLHGGEAVLDLIGEPGYGFVKGDVRDRESMGDVLEGADAVVHLAAIVGDPACAVDPELSVSVNRDASLGLTEIAREVGVDRFVFASTCSNYGRMSDTSRLATEQDPLRPVSLYAETKVEVEKHLLEGSSGLNGTVLRFATLYGLAPRMRFDLTVNQFVLEMLARRRLVVFGEKFWRPYVHVRDAARAIRLTLESEPELVSNEVFNVGATAENYRKLDLVEMISQRVPGAEVEYVHRDEDPRDYRVSFEHIAEKLGFKPERDVREGVDEVASALEDGLLADPFGGRHYNVVVEEVL